MTNEQHRRANLIQKELDSINALIFELQPHFSEPNKCYPKVVELKNIEGESVKVKKVTTLGIHIVEHWDSNNRWVYGTTNIRENVAKLLSPDDLVMIENMAGMILMSKLQTRKEILEEEYRSL